MRAAGSLFRVSARQCALTLATHHDIGLADARDLARTARGRVSSRGLIPSDRCCERVHGGGAGRILLGGDRCRKRASRLPAENSWLPGDSTIDARVGGNTPPGGVDDRQGVDVDGCSHIRASHHASSASGWPASSARSWWAMLRRPRPPCPREALDVYVVAAIDTFY